MQDSWASNFIKFLLIVVVHIISVTKKEDCPLLDNFAFYMLSSSCSIRNILH